MPIDSKSRSGLIIGPLAQGRIWRSGSLASGNEHFALLLMYIVTRVVIALNVKVWCITAYVQKISATATFTPVAPGPIPA